MFPEIELDLRSPDFMIDASIPPIAADNTNVIDTYKVPISNLIDGGMSLTKGKWKFVYSNPNAVTFLPSTEQAIFFDGQADLKTKELEIESIVYDFEKNEASIIVDIKDNPIPAIIVWGVIISATAIIGAFSANSILKRIESLGSNPVAIGGISVLILFGLAAVGFTFAKKGKIA